MEKQRAGARAVAGEVDRFIARRARANDAGAGERLDARRAESAMAIGGAARDAHFTPRDEMDLRAFFATEHLPIPGASSHFGAMLERRAVERHQDSMERPTPFVVHRGGTTSGAPWTEILACSSNATRCSAGDAEDALVAYVDAQRRNARVARVLERLRSIDRDVLRAHFCSTPADVPALTKIARKQKQAVTMVEDAKSAYARAREELRSCR